MKLFGKKVSDNMVFWGTCSVYLLFVMMLITAYTPIKLLPHKIGNKSIVSILYQPRWNVFVKRPGENIYQLYSIEKGKPVLNDLRPFQSKYLFGIRRDFKIIAIETDSIARDTNLLRTIYKYQLEIPKGANISNYINADTLKFTDVQYDDVRYLKGRYLIAITPPVVWERERKKVDKTETVTVLAVNVIHK